jgi:hypothetical protein
VQRGEHQVAGERGLDADRGGLLVAHLADHDDVGVGAQKGPHHHREIEPGLAVDLHLAQALLRDLDRVFRGPDLGIGVVEELEHRVQRGGLARAGRPADEEDPVGLGHAGLQLLEVPPREAHLLQRDGLAGGENPALLKLIEEHGMAHMVVVFDVMDGEGTFRDELYEEYKAHRDPPPEELLENLPYIKDIVRALDIPVIELDTTKSPQVAQETPGNPSATPTADGCRR